MIEFAAAHGTQLAFGLSALLVIALVVGRAHGSPARRHRWAEGVLMSVPLCAALLLVPMERALLLLPDPQTEPVTAAPTAAAASDQLGEAASFAATEPLTPDTPLLAAVFPIAFAVGAGLVLLYLLCGTLFLVRLLRGARELPGARESTDARGQSGPRIVVARGAPRPFCLGTPRLGLIVLPTALAEPGREDQLEAVLAHERTHLEDGHGRARLLATALAPALYWNPLYWLLVSRMRADAELCADDAAAGQVGKARYVRALLALVESTPPQPRPALSLQGPLLGALAPARPFLQRMESLMLRRQVIDRSVSPVWRTTSIAVIAGAVALINSACGATGTGTRAIRPIAVPFEALSLDGTGLGKALASGSSTNAPFPERVQALEGKAVAIDGYIIPLSWNGDKVDEFMLIRDYLQCCLDGAPPWDHWLHARANEDSTIPFEAGLRVRIEGHFELVHPREWQDEEYTMGVYELRGCSAKTPE